MISWHRALSGPAHNLDLERKRATVSGFTRRSNPIVSVVVGDSRYDDRGELVPRLDDGDPATMAAAVLAAIEG